MNESSAVRRRLLAAAPALAMGSLGLLQASCHSERSSRLLVSGDDVRDDSGRAGELDGNRLSMERARLVFELLKGGRRDSTILEAVDVSGQRLSLGYSPSGWLRLQYNGRIFSAFGDATGDTAVALLWSREGVALASGPRSEALRVRATFPGRTIDFTGTRIRWGDGWFGDRSFGRPIARVTIDAEVPRFPVVGAPSFVPEGYRLTFADDFDDANTARINEHAAGGRPNAPAWRSRYRHERRTVINQEKQIYVDAAFAGSHTAPLGVQPFSIADSVLRIRAARADAARVRPHIWNYGYTSGAITTELTHWQRYGYFEIKARLPRGKGLWPAFWLLPKADRWPPEIDVLEGSGVRPQAIHQAVLLERGGNGRNRSRWVDGLIDATDDFHYYGLEWTARSIRIFIDGMETLTMANPGIHEEMYLLANLALGSHDPNWIPDPDESTPLPAAFEIDHIRAYAAANLSMNERRE